jgi:hypothetical protein
MSLKKYDGTEREREREREKKKGASVLEDKLSENGDQLV